MISPRFLAACTLLSLSTVAASALADDYTEAAKTLFDRAKAHAQSGNWDLACPALVESYRLDPRPGTLFALADCEDQRGHPAEAARRYDDYLVMVASLTPDKKVRQGDHEKQALERRAALASKVAELTLVLAPSEPKGTVVTRDGEKVEENALAVPALVEPGEHVIAVEAPNGLAAEVRVTLAAGQRRAVALETPKVVPTAKRDAPPVAMSVPDKVVLIGGGALSVATAVVSVALWKEAADDSYIVEQQHVWLSAHGGCPSASVMNLAGHCAELKSNYGTLATMQNAAIWSTIGAGAVGAATLVYGIVRWRYPKNDYPLAPMANPYGGGLMVRGVW